MFPTPAPAISVLMVVYNAGRFLREAVESILRQTWRDLELVLIDNASSDGSVDELAAELRDERLRVHRLARNEGQGGGWTAGAPLCRGELVALMDGDDRAGPERLAAQRSFLEAHPEIDLVATLAERIDEAGGGLGPQFSLTREDDIRRYAEFAMPVLFPTSMMRRSLIARVGFGAGQSWAPDYEFLLRALEVGRVAGLAETHYFYRQHGGSMTLAGRRAQVLAGALAQRQAARRRRGETNVPGTETAPEWRAEAADLRTLHAQFSRVTRRDGLPALAVLHGRRARSARLVLRALGSALMREPRRLGFLCRLALWGPVHALGVGSNVHPPLGWRQVVTFGRAGAPGGLAE